MVGWDLTSLAGAQAAVSNPSAYYSAGTNTKHVIYRSADGRLHEIWWVLGGGAPATSTSQRSPERLRPWDGPRRSR